jgi:integrase/recombinase XerD
LKNESAHQPSTSLQRFGVSTKFATANGTKFKGVRDGFKNACNRAGLSDLHFHDLRHTFASQWVMAGGDLYLLKEILGHKSIVMT